MVSLSRTGSSLLPPSDLPSYLLITGLEFGDEENEALAEGIGAAQVLAS
jgi:hypothetical protein